MFGAGRTGYGFDLSDLAGGSDGDRTVAVEIEIRPSDGHSFTPDEHQIFESHVDFDDHQSELVMVRAESAVDAEGVFRTHTRFMKLDGLDDGPVDRAVRERVSFFYLPAIRDARRELSERDGLWARLTDALRGASDPDRLSEVAERAGRELAGAVFGDDRLEEMAKQISDLINKTLYSAQPVVGAEFSAAPLDYRAVLRRFAVLIRNGQDGAPLDLSRHSAGIQTLALFALFRAYLETQGGSVLAIGIEEPENHLSPHALRSMVRLLLDEDAQVILSTHSPVVAGQMDPMDAVILRRRGRTSVARVVASDKFDAEEQLRIGRIVRATSSEFLFANAVLLVEGESEKGALPEFARQAGVDLDELGVSVVGVGGPIPGMLLRLIGEECLQIPHAVVVDNDENVRKLLRSLKDLGELPVQVDAAKPDQALLEQLGIFWWEVGDFEQYLVSCDGYPAFEHASAELYPDLTLSDFRQQLALKGSPADEISAVTAYVGLRRIRKPELAAQTARQFGELGLPVPPQIDGIVKHSVVLAERAIELLVAGE